MFADKMDLLTLIRWRLTCKTNYDQSVASLRRSLFTMLRPFVPEPSSILSHITRHRSVLGGEFALAFILRDPSLLPAHLDIYSTDYGFSALCSELLEDSTLFCVIVDHEFNNVGALDALRTLVSRTLTIRTSLGTFIRVHRSYTSAATAPLSHTPSTALSNFVTAYGFGCSHPILTLNRRALVGDQEMPYLSTTDPDVHDRLILHGFSLAFSPTAWPQFRRRRPSASHTSANVHSNDNIDDSDDEHRRSLVSVHTGDDITCAYNAASVMNSDRGPDDDIHSTSADASLDSHALLGDIEKSTHIFRGSRCHNLDLTADRPPCSDPLQTDVARDSCGVRNNNPSSVHQFCVEEPATTDGPSVDTDRTLPHNESIYAGADLSLREGIEAIVQANPTSHLQRSLYMGEYVYNPSRDSENTSCAIAECVSYTLTICTQHRINSISVPFIRTRHSPLHTPFPRTSTHRSRWI